MKSPPKYDKQFTAFTVMMQIASVYNKQHLSCKYILYIHMCYGYGLFKIIENKKNNNKKKGKTETQTNVGCN